MADMSRLNRRYYSKKRRVLSCFKHIKLKNGLEIIIIIKKKRNKTKHRHDTEKQDRKEEGKKKKKKKASPPLGQTGRARLALDGGWTAVWE